MSDPRPNCGPHSEIAKTDSVRITRCPCGAIHVNLGRNGVSVQFPPDHFAEVAQAFGLANTILSGQQTAREHRDNVDTSRFITLSPFDPKKPMN